MHRHISTSLLAVAAVVIAAGSFAGSKKQEAGTSDSHPQAREASKQHLLVRPHDVPWKPGPDSLPAGAQVAVLEGDLSQAEPFTFRIKVPDGYRVPPHWHPATERVTVLQGELGMGMGEKFTREGGIKLPAGSFFMMPKGQRHFVWTSGETIVQLHGTGPWGITYVNPADDPRRAASR